MTGHASLHLVAGVNTEGKPPINGGISNAAAPDRRTRLQRFWDRMGFVQHLPDPSHMEDDPRFAAGALVTRTVTQLDWLDRVRVLVSGRVVVRSRTVTDVEVRMAITRSTFSICRPGEPL